TKPPPPGNANTTAPSTNHRLGREPRRAVFPVGASEGAGSGTPASGATGPRRPVVEARGGALGGLCPVGGGGAAPPGVRPRIVCSTSREDGRCAGSLARRSEEHTS